MLAERQGIEIDYCPQCRGVWLDRGELDKIIDRASEPVSRKKSDYDDEDRTDHRHGHSGGHVFGKQDEDYARRHKKKSLLGEIFDF